MDKLGPETKQALKKVYLTGPEIDVLKVENLEFMLCSESRILTIKSK